MARKTNKAILTEGEMRRFMKLANVSPLKEMGYDVPGARDEDEEVMEEEEEMGEEEEEVEAAEMEAELPAEMPEEEPEMEMDMEMGAEEGGEKMIDLDDFMSALETALENVTGEEVSTDMDMEGGEEAPEEGGDSLDMEMSPEPEMDMDMGGEEEMDMDMMAERIARRVKARMMQESRKRIQKEANEKRIEELTDRIFARLMKESR
jgi:hypothetical protein